MRRKATFVMMAALAITFVFADRATLAQETMDMAIESVEDVASKTDVMEELDKNISMDVEIQEETIESQQEMDNPVTDEITPDTEQSTDVQYSETWETQGQPRQADQSIGQTDEAEDALFIDVISVEEVPTNIEDTLSALSATMDDDGQTVDLVALDETNFPDENFRLFVEQYDINNSGGFSQQEMDAVNEISLYLGSEIESLKGIEYFRNLVKLECAVSDLTALDVSNNTALQYLDCSGNQITVLDLSKNPNLKTLNCNSNQLTTLDVSNNTVLENLSCTDNEITTLTLNGCASLQVLDCYENQISTLDASDCTALQKLNCGKADFGGNQLTALDVSKNANLECLYCSNNRIAALDVSNNSVLESLDCSNNQLTVLDISKNTDLKKLDCRHNYLPTLDVSKNTDLKSLYTDNNQITTLSLSNNKALYSLWCDNNQISELDVRNNKALTILSCSNNQITTLDVSNNANLWSLECSNNQIIALDVSKNINLESLDCSNNQIIALDVSKNINLESLDCSNNQIVALDLDQNSALFCDDDYFEQTRTVQLHALANGWQLDMAKLVGKDNLYRLSFESDVPSMGKDGIIIFKKDNIPESINYKYDSAQRPYLWVKLILEKEPMPSTKPTEPTQPSISTKPEQTGQQTPNSSQPQSSIQNTTENTQERLTAVAAAAKKIKIVSNKLTSPKKKTVKLTWKKNTKVTGYEIQYAFNKKFKSSKTITIKKNKTQSKSFKVKKSKKTCYVRIRSFKKIGKSKVYGKWSKVKKVKVK